MLPSVLLQCHNMDILVLPDYFLREALFPIRGARKSVVRPCSSVRKIIDFSEEDMEDGRVLLSTGTLNS